MDKFFVENITIKLDEVYDMNKFFKMMGYDTVYEEDDNDDFIKFPVALDGDDYSPYKTDEQDADDMLYEEDDYEQERIFLFMESTEGTLNEKVNLKKIKNIYNYYTGQYNDIDLEEVEQTIEKHRESDGWDINEFDLDIFKHNIIDNIELFPFNYLINNILGIRYGYLFGQNKSLGVSITIPTTKLEYFKDMIFFEVRNSFGENFSLNIFDFISSIRMSHEKVEKLSVALLSKDIHLQYDLICAGTNLVIEERDTCICIAFYLM